MDAWFRKQGKRAVDVDAYTESLNGMSGFYRDAVLPVEKAYSFQHFYGPPLADADISATPMVLLLGQYSSGKTSFIRHLLGRDYPGLRIGAEPTTDKFVAISHGERDRVVPGRAAATDDAMPFTQLDHLGGSFLDHFECAQLKSPCLEGVTLIDTPGVLSGRKQTVKRSYDFKAVVKWFAARADLILVFFDVQKIDISDEFGKVIQTLKSKHRNVRIVLNKADGLEMTQLMRVYASLSFNLGRRLDAPELPRVFMGSYWDQPLKSVEMRHVFEADENDLFTMIAQLPCNAAVAKFNDLIKRAQLAKVHIHLIDAFARRMPATGIGRDREFAKVCDNLQSIFEAVSKDSGLPPGDFPSLSRFAEQLRRLDAKKLLRTNKPMLRFLDEGLQHHMPPLLRKILDQMPHETAELAQIGAQASPFAVMKVGGQNEMTNQRSAWLTTPDVDEYRAEFQGLGPNENGEISGQRAKEALVDSQLPSKVLHQIWVLADIKKDGKLDLAEYTLARHFIKMRLAGHDLPGTTPPEMLPRN